MSNCDLAALKDSNRMFEFASGQDSKNAIDTSNMLKSQLCLTKMQNMQLFLAVLILLKTLHYRQRKY